MIEYANCIKKDVDNITFHFYRGNVWGHYDYKVSDIKEEYLEFFHENDTSHFGERYWPEVSEKVNQLYSKYDEQIKNK